MKKLLARIGILILGSIVMLVAVRQVGSHAPDTLAVILGGGHATLPQACWYAICPQRASKPMMLKVLADIAKANAARMVYDVDINESGYTLPYDGCTTYIPPGWNICAFIVDGLDPIESYVVIRTGLATPAIRLRDIVARLGAPSSMRICAGLGPNLPTGTAEGTAVSLTYKNGIAVTAFRETKYNPPIYPTPPNEWRIDPDMEVYRIEFFPATPYTGLINSETTFVWSGFTKGPELHSNCGN